MAKVVICDICCKNIAKGKFYANMKYKRHIFKVKYYICEECSKKYKELGELANLV